MSTSEQASESVPAVPLSRAPVRKRARKSAPRSRPAKPAQRRKTGSPSKRAKRRKQVPRPALLDWTDDPPQQAPRAWRQLEVWTRRAIGLVLGLAVLGAVTLTGLLMVTPPVRNAAALATAFDRAHGAMYPGQPVPERFALALTSTEDHRFYSEPGIDPVAIARVIGGRLTLQPDQGGSTLYQQLAKMLYTHGRPGLLAQTQEIVLGIKLDLNYNRPEILQMYSDVAYFGHGYYGLFAASCGYFGVIPAALTWSQSAMLAGLVQAPSADDPLTHFANARARQAHVLGRLVATGRLSLVQAQWAYRDPLHLVRGPATGCLAAGPFTP
ncbi:MAG TPA: biosynthetic peptidoglycan transglycosylase [Streptosporangiaceae bacterium]